MSLKSTKLSVHLRKKHQILYWRKKVSIKYYNRHAIALRKCYFKSTKVKEGFFTKTFTFAITLNFMTREFEWSGLQIKIDHFNAVLPLQSKNTFFYDFELNICKCARISYDKKVFIEVRTVLTVVCFVYSIHVEYCYGCSV